MRSVQVGRIKVGGELRRWDNFRKYKWVEHKA